MKQNDKRIEDIFKSIQDIASGKFTTRIEISDALDEIDGIATGINMLAEEVHFRTEKFSEEQEKLTNTINQLKELKLALSKSEELFLQIFQTSPDGISITRLSDGIFVEINKSFEKLTGYSRKDLIGQSVFDFEMWTNLADREMITSQLKQKGYYTNLEADFRIKEGKIQRGLVSASILNINDEPHMVTISRNITGIREAEAPFIGFPGESSTQATMFYQSNLDSSRHPVPLVKHRGTLTGIVQPFPAKTEVSVWAEINGMRTPETGTYSHHGHITYYKDVLFATWDNQANDGRPTTG